MPESRAGPLAAAIIQAACGVDARGDAVGLGTRIAAGLREFVVHCINYGVYAACDVSRLPAPLLETAKAAELADCMRRGGRAWLTAPMPRQGGVSVTRWRELSAALSAEQQYKLLSANQCNMMTDLYSLALAGRRHWLVKSRALGTCTVEDAFVVRGRYRGPYANPLLVLSGGGELLSLLPAETNGLPHVWMELRVRDARGRARAVGIDFSAAQLDLGPAPVVWHDLKPRPAGYGEESRVSVHAAAAEATRRIRQSVDRLPARAAPFSPRDVAAWFAS